MTRLAPRYRARGIASFPDVEVAPKIKTENPGGRFSQRCRRAIQEDNPGFFSAAT